MPDQLPILATEAAAILPLILWGKITFDRSDYKKVWMDTPMKAPAPERRFDLAPGTCVKTPSPSDASPILCGKVSSNDGDKCIVIGHGWENWDSERFVWRGTNVELHSQWRID